jgi:pilus assembly protein CpaC
VEELRPTAPVRLAQAPEEVPPLRGGAQQPPAAPEDVEPPPRSDVFSPARPRLQRLPRAPGGVAGPVAPNPEAERRFGQFIDRTVDPETTLDVIVGRPRLLLLKQAPTRVQIADERIASYLVITPTEISVQGHEVGSTVLNLWFEDVAGGEPQILSYLVRVFQDPDLRIELDRIYEALQEEINQAFPDSKVQLSLVGDKLVVRGEAHDIVEASQILQIVDANAPDTGEPRDVQEVNFVQRNVQAGYEEPFPSSVRSALQIDEINYAGGLTDLYQPTSSAVINLLKVTGEQQVMLRVTVAEVNRSAARSIGLNFRMQNDSGLTVFQQLTGAIGLGNLPTFLDNGQIFLAIEALRTMDLARSLAEPNLVTLNGQPARFRAGGQFPVPSAALAFGGVGQGVAFVPFGVELQFVPYITDRDRVRLQVAATVSTRDESLGVNVGGSEDAGGTEVSGLQARSFQTTVELREGQTLAVGGLLQNNVSASTNRVPFFGDLPLLGHLGGRSSTTGDEQELMILITPELVHPLEACETPPIVGHDVYEPGDVEFFLFNQLESRRYADFRSGARTDWHRQMAWHQCEDSFIVGPQGHSYGCCSDPAAGAFGGDCQNCVEDSDLPQR